MEESLANLEATGDGVCDVDAGVEEFDACKRAVENEPESAAAHFNLGRLHAQQGRSDEAEKCYRRALELRPDHAEVANSLGIILAARREFGEAERLFRLAIAENIDYFAPHFNLGNLLTEGFRIREARYHFARALALRPESTEAMERFGMVLSRAGRNEEAIAMLLRVVERDDNLSLGWKNLAISYLHSGDLASAAAAFRRALACSTPHKDAWHGLLLMSNYLGSSRQEEFELHRAYGEAAAREIALLPHANSPDPGRRLRIGFVTADLRRHSVSYFVKGVLSRIDRRQFQLWAYFNHPLPDQRTAEFKPLFYRWRDIIGRSDAEVAHQIQKDGIDILIDLSGHTSHTRLEVFAFKPAPVQVSWIGYPNTTGLPQIDYRLTDAIADPEGEADAYYVERLWRLPASFLCYSPPEYAPGVVEPPCLARGYVTFGSFSTRTKVGAECIALWSRVLKAVPDSRLVIKSVLGLEEAKARDALRDRFAAKGVDPARITVASAKVSQEDHLAMYGEIDVALDTYPYSGVTTTCEALWMGVPVVTRLGDRHVSRVGASILTQAGLTDLIAEDDDQFVDIACQLAADFDVLSGVRQALRGVLKASRLLDERSMAADFSAALRRMWEIYCETRSGEVTTGIAGGQDRSKDEEAGGRLIIGSAVPREGWQVFSQNPGEGIDFDGDPCNLSRFGDGDYREVYCAHLLQRLGQADVMDYLRDLHRILRPGGKLYLSVPDMDVLVWLLNSPLYAKTDKFQMMRLLFGQQADELDFNHIGLNIDFLRDYLQEAGFSAVDHVESFGLFDDASELRVDAIRVSLNLVAVK